MARTRETGTIEVAELGPRSHHHAPAEQAARETLGDELTNPVVGEERIHPQRLSAHHSSEAKRALGNRLRRIEGQVRGIARMIDQDVYCDEVLNQITSVEAALKGVSKQLLEAHVRSCVVDQLARGELGVVDELMKTIGRMVP